MIKKWIVVLGFSKLPIPEKIKLLRAIIKAMTGNSHFSTPRVSMADMTSKTDLLALKESEAETGDHSKVAEMHEVEHDAELMVDKQVAYVEEIANDNFATGDSIIKSAAMKPQKVAVHEARQFKVTNTDMPGQGKAVTKGVVRASFIWMYSTDQINWITAGTTIKAQLIISGLTSGTKYYFRVAVVTKDGQGPFSNVF